MNELSVNEILQLDPTEVDADQKTFLQEHVSEVPEEHITKFGLTKTDPKETKKEDGELFDASKIEPEVRRKADAEKKPIDKGIKDDDEDDGILDEDKKAFEKFASRLIKPLQDEISALKGNTDNVAVVSDVNSFLTDHSEYAKYKAGIVKYAQHPSYSNVSIDNIAFIVSGKDQQAIGARKEREAVAKAKATQIKENGGDTIVEDKNAKPDFLAMPKKDFEAARSKILGQA